MQKQTTSNEMTADQFRRKYVDQEEHGLQARAVKWFRGQYPQLMMVAIPNAGKRTKAERGRLIAEGMIRGWPDLHLAYPTNGLPGLYIETKTVNGVVSDEQAIVHAYLRSVGYPVEIPKTFEEFQYVVEAYLHP
jgi:hypothetical protein